MRVRPQIVVILVCTLSALFLGLLAHKHGRSPASTPAIEAEFEGAPVFKGRSHNPAPIQAARLIQLPSEPPAAVIPAHTNPERRIQESADPITALAALTDFQKLATLSTAARAANPRVKKILYWLYVAEEKGIEPATALDRAFTQNGNDASPRAAGAKTQTLINFNQAKIWGMFTPGALELLKHGNAAPIVRGTWAGQPIEIDHIVPLSRYPQFGNELANLQLLPAKENRSKSDRMGGVEFQKLQELQRLPPIGPLRPTTSPRTVPSQ